MSEMSTSISFLRKRSSEIQTKILNFKHILFKKKIKLKTNIVSKIFRNNLD
jgi:hypothetical protein